MQNNKLWIFYEPNLGYALDLTKSGERYLTLLTEFDESESKSFSNKEELKSYIEENMLEESTLRSLKPEKIVVKIDEHIESFSLFNREGSVYCSTGRCSEALIEKEELMGVESAIQFVLMKIDTFLS